MLLRTEYLKKLPAACRRDTTLESDNKKLGIFQWDNRIRPGDNQRITAGITGNLGAASVSPATASTRTADLAYQSRARVAISSVNAMRSR
ncbi:MAG: hypothetical protein U1F16_09565 [Turneriella sp.]